MGTIRALALAACLLGVSTLSPARGHDAETGRRPRLLSVDPAVPGLHVEVRQVLAPTVVVRNDTLTPVEVLGGDGRPFLRIGPTGVEADLASPDFHRSESPVAGSAAPAPAAGGEPRFVRIADGMTWAWFEHRIEAARPTWTVPLAVDGRAVTITGDWEPVEVKGSFTVVVDVISPAVPGLDVEPLQGSVPGLFVDNATGRVVEVPGPAGRPYLRIGPDEVQRADGAGGWSRLATGARFAWTEPRVGWPPADPLPARLLGADSVTTAREWSLDLRVGDQPVAVSGRLLWVPVVTHHDDADGWTNVPLWAAVAALAVVAAGAGAGVWRRRRPPP